MTIDLAIFLIGTFVAAYVTGLAGFAFGMVAAAIWLHAISPVHAIVLIVAYALLVQGYAVWQLRRAINVRRLIPFIVGSAVGIPAGLVVLNWATASPLRVSVGVLLILFALYNLARPNLPQFKQAGATLDGVVGIGNGLIGGATGLAGILPMVWSGMRGWTKDEQRAVFQPTAVATFLILVLAMGGTGTITLDIARLFVLGLPALIAGTWLGWKSYGRLDEAIFRKIVLYLLLASGAALVIAAIR